MQHCMPTALHANSTAKTASNTVSSTASSTASIASILPALPMLDGQNCTLYTGVQSETNKRKERVLGFLLRAKPSMWV